MSFGILLKGFNEYFFKRWLNFFLDFIPQFIFFNTLFGYLVLLIFIKWATDYEGRDLNEVPSIINALLDTFMKGGEVVDY